MFRIPEKPDSRFAFVDPAVFHLDYLVSFHDFQVEIGEQAHQFILQFDGPLDAQFLVGIPVVPNQRVVLLLDKGTRGAVGE